MRANGRLENWVEYEIPHMSGNVRGLRGQIFELDIVRGGLYLDGSDFDMLVVTEPPYFKSRIVQTNIGNFYILGEPLNKEDNLV